MNSDGNISNYIWPGLAPYQETDQTLFFGRSVEILDLSRKIISSKMAILFGPSGAGKTSLLQAGVFKVLRQNKILPVPVRIDFPPSDHEILPVIEQVGMALKQVCNRQQINLYCQSDPWFEARKNRLTLWEWLKMNSLYDGEHHEWQPLFVFDQFEEIFTLGKQVKGMETFLQQLGDAAENFLPQEVGQFMNDNKEELPFILREQKYRFLFSIREDYFAQLQGLKQVMPGVTTRQNYFALGKLNGTQAYEAVMGPAPEGTISEKVAREIVHFVALATEGNETERDSTFKAPDEMVVEPSILSLVCRQLYSRRNLEGQQVITLDFVKQSKGRILKDFYESSIALTEPKTRIFIEDHLLDAEGFRMSEPESNFNKHGINSHDIQTLVNQRILHHTEHYGRSHFELSHDVLVPVVRQSRETRHFLEEESARNKEIHQLNRQRRRTLIISSVLGLLFLASFAAFLFGIYKRNEAETQSIRAKAFYFNAVSQQIMDSSPDKAIRYAQLAYLLDSSKHNAKYILKIIYNNTTPCSRVSLRGRIGGYSSDGKRILTIQSDSTVLLWDSEGNHLAKLRGHKDIIYNAHFSPDGTRILSSSWDQTAKLWDLSGRLLLDIDNSDLRTGGAQFTPDGQFILNCHTNDSSIYVLDLKGNIRNKIEIINDSISYYAGSPDSKYIAIGTTKGKIQIRELNGKLVNEFNTHTEEFGTLQFSYDGNYIITICNSYPSKPNLNVYVAKLWDLKGNLLNTFENTAGEFDFSYDGKFILFLANDSTVKIFDIKRKLVTLTKKLPSAYILKINFSPNGKLFSTTSMDRIARIWDFEGNLLTELRGFGPPLPGAYLNRQYAVFSPDGEEIMISFDSECSKIWNINGNLIRNWSNLTSADISFNATLISTLVNKQKHFKLADISGNNLIEADSVIYFVFSPDSRWVLLELQKGNLKLYNTETKQLNDFRIRFDSITTAKFSPDNKMVLLYHKNGNYELSDLEGHQVSLITGSDKRKDQANFSPDGKYLITVMNDSIVKIFDLNGKEIVKHRERYSGNSYLIKKYPGICSALIFPDNRRFLTWHIESVRVWDFNCNLLNEQKDFFFLNINSVRISPDGKTVAVSDDRHRFIIWNPEGNKLIENKSIAHSQNIKYSDDGSQLAVSNYSGSVLLLDAAGNQIAELKGHTDYVTSITFLPDCGRIFTFSPHDGNAKFWPGLPEIILGLNTGKNRAKLTIEELAKNEIKLSKEEFDLAFKNNALEGTYWDYQKLWTQMNLN